MVEGAATSSAKLQGLFVAEARRGGIYHSTCWDDIQQFSASLKLREGRIDGGARGRGRRDGFSAAWSAGAKARRGRICRSTRTSPEGNGKYIEDGGFVCRSIDVTHGDSGPFFVRTTVAGGILSPR